MKTPMGLLRVVEPRARGLDAARDHLQAVLLADDALVERVGELEHRLHSFLTMRPTGMPVQSATTEATACSSTEGRMSGDSPCTAGFWPAVRAVRRAARRGRVRAWAAAGVATAAASAAVAPPACCPRAACCAGSRSTSPFSSCQRAFSAGQLQLRFGQQRLHLRRALGHVDADGQASRPMISCSTSSAFDAAHAVFHLGRRRMLRHGHAGARRVEQAHRLVGQLARGM
jgi:hypothetical protein